MDDVFAAGERVELTAPIAGTAHLMARRVSSAAEIGGGLYAAGADVGVSAPVAGDAALAGYDVTVEGAVGGDLRAAARHLRVAAPVAGTALLTGETVTIDAAIEGDAAVTADDLDFGPGARFGGRLSLYGHNADEIAVPGNVAPAERIERHPGEPRPGPAGSAAAADGPGWLAGTIGLAVGVLILAVLAFAVALFAPNAVERLAALTAARPFHTFWIGFLTLSTLIGATVLAVATVVGILVAPALILAAGVLGFLGYLVAVYLLGRALWVWVGRFPPDTLPERALAALVGAVAGDRDRARALPRLDQPDGPGADRPRRAEHGDPAAGLPRLTPRRRPSHPQCADSRGGRPLVSCCRGVSRGDAIQIPSVQTRRCATPPRRSRSARKADMASFVLFDGSTTARTLAAGEFGFIGQQGSLAVSGTAISSSGNVEVTLFGSLFATDSAIDHSTGSFVLQVGASGTANSSNDDTFDIDFATTAFVSNDGSLLSGSDALDIRGNGLLEILNTGSISGRSDGIVSSAIEFDRGDRQPWRRSPAATAASTISTAAARASSTSAPSSAATTASAAATAGTWCATPAPSRAA